MRNDPAMYYQEQVEQWRLALDEEDSEQNRNACRQLLDEAASLNAQYQRVLHAHISMHGALTLSSTDNYCIFSEDASESGRFRYQVFNKTGFIGHTTRDTVGEVLLEAFKDGFRTIESSFVLGEFSRTVEWQRGSLVNDLVQKVNRGILSYDEANLEHEAGLKRIYAQPDNVFAAFVS